MNRKFHNFITAQEAREAVRQTGLEDDQMAEDLLKRMESPFKNGAHQAKAANRLAHLIANRVMYLDRGKPRSETTVAVPPGLGFIVGYRSYDPATGHFSDPLGYSRNWMEEHVAICGGTGSGKTEMAKFWLGQVVPDGVFVEFVDYKDEGRRIPGARVFRANEFPWNPLEPIGPSSSYYPAFLAELASAFQVRVETWTDLIRILINVEHGLNGNPYLSPKDFERLLFLLGRKQNNPKYLTAGSVFAALNAVLGRTAYIRKAPDVSERYPVIIHDYQGLPLRICSFLSAIHLLRAKLKTTATGHA